MLSDKNFEELISNIVDQTNILKNSCKAQIIQISHSNNPENLMRSLRNCYETSELCDLLLLYITNQSPNITSCINFTHDVLNSCIKECKKIDNVNSVKDTSKFCIKQCEKLDKLLIKFNNNIQ